MNSRILNFGSILILAVISLAVFKVLMQIHDATFYSLAEAAYGVIEGKPHWIAYQNRLLGPYLVYFVSMFGFSYAAALKIFILLTLFLQNLLLFYLIRKMDIANRESLIWVMLYSFVFVLVQHRWFYTWDSIDAMIFTLFAWGIIKKKTTTYFVALFFVALLNRESAMFIALYIMLDAISFKSIMHFRLNSIKQFLAGFLLLASGLIYTKFIRHYLFVAKADGEADTKHELIGNHVYLIRNIKDLIYNNAYSTDIINSFFIIGSVLYLSFFIRQYLDYQIKALLIYLAMVANILIFGLINETRMFIILIPFFLFLFLSIEKNVNQTRTT